MRVLISALFVLLLTPIVHANEDLILDGGNSVNTGDVQIEAINYFYSFGSVRLGHVRSAFFTLRNNNGRFPILIDDIRTNGQGFAEGNDCPRILFPRQRCHIRVDFAPFHLGQHNGILQIRLTGSQDINVHLRGWGIF